MTGVQTCALPIYNDIDNTLMLPIDTDRSVESRKFIEIVEGRLLEIIENVWSQVPGEYADRLLGGIILTGGGSNMKNIETAFRNHTHIDKIRIAKFVTHTITSNNSDITSHNGMMNTILGLLAKGDMNCAGQEVTQNGDLFNAEQKQGMTPKTGDLHQNPRRPDELGSGVVLTAAEKAAAEEKKRKEAEVAARLEEERRKKEEEEKKKKSMGNVGKKVKNFLFGLLKEPEDE